MTEQPEKIMIYTEKYRIKISETKCLAFEDDDIKRIKAESCNTCNNCLFKLRDPNTIVDYESGKYCMNLDPTLDNDLSDYAE